jgi:amphi-Trp domain-containing protein
MSKKKVKIESVMELSQVSQYLEDVLQSIRDGSINVEKGTDSITLVPQNIVRFEMCLSRKKDKEKVSLEISWKCDPEAVAANNVQIGSAENEMKIS